MINHLNYFHPYTADREQENSLTRAFMSLLRLCPPIQQGFYNMVRKKAILKAKDSEREDFPTYHEWNSLAIEADAQRQKLPPASRYLSVLISGDEIPLKRGIEPIERGSKAQYDGLFQIDDLTLFIENKPRNDIREDQLCPHSKDMEAFEEYHLYDFPVNITWRSILTFLNKMQEKESTDYTQGKLIGDFLDFVDERFPYLNPFNKFHLCKSNGLAQRRIHQLLSDIVTPETEVGWHRGWGHYIATPQYPYLGKIGLNLWGPVDDGNWSINLSFVIADTTEQARALFKWSQINPDTLLQLKNEGWVVRANFHIGFMQSNLVFFPTEDNRFGHYLDYWKEHPIKQVKAEVGESNVFTAADKYLNGLAREEVITYGPEQKAKVEKEFGKDKQRKTANIRPGIFVGRNYSAEEAIKLDSKDRMENTLKRDIHHFFEVLTGEKANFLK